MQKKLLACLLATPVAGVSLANVEFTNTLFPGLQPQNVTGTTQGFRFNFLNGGVGLVAPIGTGTVEFQTLELCPGTYTLNVAGAQNLKVSVVSGGQEIVGGNGSVNFTLTDNASVTVKMSAVNDAQQFLCSGASLEIEFNEDEYSAALTQALNSINIATLRDDVADKALAEKLTVLTQTKENIANDIAKIVKPLELDVYKNFDLWKSAEDCTIGVAIADLAKEVEAFNEAAAVANEAAEKLDAQNKAYNRLKNQANAYQSNLDNIKKQAGEADGEGSDFVSKKIADKAAAFQKKIEVLTAAIEEQKAGLGLNGTAITGFEYPAGTDYSSMMADLNALKAELREAVREKEAWGDYEKALDDLTKYYNELYTLVNSLQDVDGKTGDVFGKARATCLEDLTKAYNASNNSDGALSLGSSVGDVNNGYNKTLRAKREMGTLYSDFETLVSTQNAAYKAAQEQATAFQADLTAAAGDATKVPDAQKKKYDALVAAANAALKDFKDYVEQQYGANTLPGDEYAAKEQAVTDAIAALKLATDNYGPLLGLQADLQTAVDKVKEISDALNKWNEENETGLTMDLYGKFKGQIDGLNAALTALNPKPDQDAAIEAVKAAIDAMPQTAQELSDAYKTAATGYTAFKKDLDAYKEFVANKLIIEGANYDKSDANTGLGVLNELFAGYEKDINNVIALPSQGSYDTAVALAKKIEADDWQTQLTNFKEAFAKKATEENGKYVEHLLALWRKKFNNDAELNKIAPAKTALASLSTKSARIRKEITNAGNDTEKLGACDVELQSLVGDITTFGDNLNAYIAYMDLLKDIPEDIAAASAYNENTNINPAKDYFKGLLDETTGEYITRYNDLKAALDQALADGSLKAGMEGETGFNAKVNSLVSDVDGVQKRIELNLAAYNELLSKSKNVLAHIDGVIAYFNKNCQDPSVLEEYLNALQDLKAVDLAGVDVSMTGDFGKGALNDAKKGEYFTQYDKISAKADEFLKKFDDGVSDLNASTAGNWEQTIADLRSLKDQAVKVYNAFFYDITNKGYREFIDADLITHEGLYDYTKKITELEAAIQKFIDDSNADKVAFSADQFKEEATDKMAAMKDAINADKDALIAEMNRLGALYWTDQNDYRQGVYTALYNSMKAAGMFADETTEDGRPIFVSQLAGKCPVLSEALNSYFDAVAKHQAVVEAAAQDPKPENYTYKQEIGYEMDVIANMLDKVEYNEAELEAAADILWDAYYKDFSAQAAADLASVDTAEEYSFATPEQKEAAKTAIQEQIDNAAAYNEQATAEDANTLSVLQDGGKAALDAVADEIQKILDNLKKQSDAKKAADELYEDYTGNDGIIPNLDDELQKLIDYAASLAADSRPETTGAIADVRNAIDALSQNVEANKGDLAAEDNKAEAERLTNVAKGAIADAYTAIRGAETTVLNGIMVQVREAFNNAKAETEWSDKNAAAMEEKIDAAIATIAGLGDLTDEEFQKAAQTLETNLCDYLAELEAVYTHPGTNTSAVDAMARLTAQYEAVQAALEAAKAELAKCEPSVQEAFTNAYVPSEEALAAAQAGYSGAGDKIVALEGNYAADLNAVQKMIDEKKAEIDAANKAALEQKAIDANAVALQEQIDGYKQQLEELRSYLSTYMLDTPEQLGTDLSTIENAIAQMQNALNTMIEDKTLTADTKLGSAPMVENMLKNLNYTGHIAAVEYVNGLAETAVSDARANLSRAHFIAETRSELSNQLNEAEQLRLNAMQAMIDAVQAYESSEQTAENLATFIAAAEEAMTDLTKAENDARAVSEGVYNNEFTPGDVELDPDGDVTVADYQQVVTWVGEGMTYQQLLETNPRQAYAADVNGDKRLNISDAVAVLNIALEDLNDTAAAPRLLAKGVKDVSDNHISLALNETENGIREYAVRITNNAAFVAGQLDIKVGAGMEIVDIELTGRAADHELYRFDNSTGARVIVASLTNSELNDNDGALLIVRTRGAGNLEVEEAIFADAKATAYSLSNAGLSGIDSITEGCQNVKERIYNVAGQAMQRLQRGINIIRKSDGTTTKKIQK